MFSKILLSVLFLLGLLSSVLADPSLGITKDNSFDSKHIKTYNSKCNMKSKPSDGQFLKMVESAWHEMNSSIPETKNKKYDMPFAMIGLAIENEVYFASSIKAGKTSIVYESKTGDGTKFKDLPPRYQEVMDALKKCTAKNTGKPPQHGNNAACGEIMSTILWMSKNNPKAAKDYEPRVAAWCKFGYLPPCSSEEGAPDWGCHDWTAEMGYNVIGDIPREDYDEPEKCEPVSLKQCLQWTADEEKTRPKATKGSS